MSDGAQPCNHRTLGNTAAATTTVDFSTASFIYLRLTQAANTIALRSMRRGATYKLLVQQDGVGGRTIAGFTYNGAAVTPVAGASVGVLDLGIDAYTLYEFVGLNSSIAPGVAVAISAVTGAMGAITGDDVNITATDDINVTAGDDIAINAVGATGRVSINGADLVALGASAANGTISLVTTGANGTINVNASGATSDVAIAATDDITVAAGDALAVTCGGNASITCTAGSVTIASGGAGSDISLQAVDACAITGAGTLSMVSSAAGVFFQGATTATIVGTTGVTIRSGGATSCVIDAAGVARITTNSTGIGFYDSPPAAQPAAIPDAAGGTEIATINAILAALRVLGIIDT